MPDPTIHDLKIQDAQACIREHLSHVDGGARCYATRTEALQTARDIINTNENLDGAQITEAFEPWADEMENA